MAELIDAKERGGDSEKITINLGFVDLGRVDLLVRDGFYANRTDFIRAAIRNQLAIQGDDVRQAMTRRKLELGLLRLTRAELEAHRQAGRTLEVNVIGLALIEDDVTPDLARQTIRSLTVLGSLQASRAVRTALADRTK